jgi:hypothetical protein
MSWQKCLGGKGADEASEVRQTQDGGFVLVGDSESDDGDVRGGNKGRNDAWIVKLASQMAE